MDIARKAKIKININTKRNEEIRIITFTCMSAYTICSMRPQTSCASTSPRTRYDGL